MAIGKTNDLRNERNGCVGFENKLHDIKRNYCKETLSSKVHIIMDYDIPTDYDTNETYLIPNDANLDPEYNSMEYSKGILLNSVLRFIFRFPNSFYFINCFLICVL